MKVNKRRQTILTISASLVGLLIFYLAGYWRKPSPSFALWLLDFFVLVVAFLGGTMLVSQFVLPVITWPDRNRAFSRMMSYLQRAHGPILFVKNGKKIAREGEEKKKGPGVILVDSASAVVLQTSVAFKRALGPGVVFTNTGEFIAETLDLHVQSRKQKDAKAITKDGIEVTANITVRFMLERGHARPGQWDTKEGPPYYFDEHAAFRAIYGEAVRERHNVPWTELPPLVAVDVWRELLLQRTLDDLFPEQLVDPMPIAALQGELNARLKPPSAPLPESRSREYQLLFDRGVRVLSVGVGNIRVPDELARRRMINWRSSWRRRAAVASSQYDTELNKIRSEGRRAGWESVISTIKSGLHERIRAKPSMRRKNVLQLLLDGTFKIIDSLGTESQSQRQREVLLEMRRWLDTLDDDGNAPEALFQQWQR